MLKKIKISNFYSIGNEQEMSLAINAKDVLDDSARKHAKDGYLNIVTCIIGPNASGKTNLLKAFGFLAWFVEKSYTSLKADEPIPIEPHQLHKEKPTKIEIEFYQDSDLYRYIIQFNKERVVEEQLERRVERFTSVFKLIRDKNTVHIKTGNVLKLSENDEKRLKDRHNISFLSALIDLGYLPAITFFKNFVSNINQTGHMRASILEEAFETSNILYNNKEFMEEMLSFSNKVGLGISEFAFDEITLRKLENPQNTIKKNMLRCIHTSKDKKFSLPIYEESNGTQRSYYLFSKIIPILKSGGLVVFDEIEDGLHPYMAKQLISLFENKDTNPHNAQLIFITHQHLLLNDRTKTQIFITERNPDSFETEVYRLDDVEGVRNDENYFHKYMAGAYGGAPDIKWL